MIVSLCMIVKDEEAVLRRSLLSVRPYVDEINVYDTGSTDGTPALLEELAAEPGAPIRVEHGEWRDHFAWAREQSFAMASDRADWLMWIDADDELIGGEHLRPVLARAADVDTVRLHHTSQHHQGTLLMWRDAVVRRGAASWSERVHEYLLPVRPGSFLKADRDIIQLIDRRSRRERSPDHYLRLVEQSVAEGSTRNLWSLATIRSALQDYAGAVAALEQYLARPDVSESMRKRALDALQQGRRLAGEQMRRAVGRNEPCPCGSGKKFKRCHGGSQERPATAESSPVVSGPDE